MGGWSMAISGHPATLMSKRRAQVAEGGYQEEAERNERMAEKGHQRRAKRLPFSHFFFSSGHNVVISYAFMMSVNYARGGRESEGSD